MLKTSRFFKASVIFLVLVTILATFHKIFVHGGGADNNLKTYLWSYHHLMANLDMYALYPEEHGDFLKYTPTFGLMIWPFTLLPYKLTALLFNLTNLVVFLWGLNGLSIRQADKNLMLWVCVPELTGAIQNFQTNALIAGLFLVAYNSFRKVRFLPALLAVATAFFIKIFAMALLPLGWVATRTARQRWVYLGLGLLVFVFIFAIPGFFVGFDNLLWQYQNYLRLQGQDNAEQTMGFYSLMHIVAAVTGLKIKNIYFQLIGAGVVLLPFLLNTGRRLWQERPQALFASSVLFMLVFNHRSESETFIIGMVGFMVWWLEEPRTMGRWALLLFNLACVSLLYGDVLSGDQKVHYLEPIFLKIWGVVLTWFIIQYQIWREVMRDILGKRSSPTSSSGRAPVTVS